MIPLVDALAAARDRRILHRDKPSNIHPDGPKITDFGCAQVRRPAGTV